MPDRAYPVTWTVEQYREREGLDLLPHHHAQLAASGVTLDVAAERGYRSVTTKTDIQELGFAASQQRSPALVVPLWSVDGDVALYQIRPDEPRRNDGGKPIKYETPRKAALRLDVHPRMRTYLGDPERPLFITEGIKKADAATTADLCCIALLGVTGWRGRNQDGSITALADWEQVALKGRRVFLVFDSDVMTKTAVYVQLGRLRTWLTRKGAEVLVVYLPSGEGAAKTGLDDFLAAGHSKDDLLALATTEFRHPDNTEPGAPCWDIEDYHVSAADGTFRRDREGERRKLADFAAHIERKDVEDDGDESRERDGAELLERQRYHLVIQQGRRMARHQVTAASFHGMQWPAEVASMDLIVAGGSSIRTYLREAIELVSREVARIQHPERGGLIPRHTVYVHTGWRLVGGRHVYLHAGGGIGEGGVVEGIQVRLSPQFARLALPAPPEGDELVKAVAASLSLLELGPDELMVPLLGAVYRSVLAPADFSVHSHGDSGRFKSEVMALAQSHFGGPFDSRELPLSWTSTGNSLEGLLHETACMAVLVDDFLPGGLTPSEREKQLTAAARVFRAQGNRQGRSRMRADTSLRMAKEPRGLTLSTGEEIPPGLSQIARVWLIEQGRDAITPERLTAAQQAAGLFAPAMAGYVRWLAPRMEGMVGALRREGAERRDVYRAAHRRTSDIAASLEAGWTRFLAFAVECGVITERQRGELAARVRTALLKGAAAQARHLHEVNPVEHYVHGLAAALSAGAVYVSTFDDSTPPDPGAWGWRQRPGAFEKDVSGVTEPVWEPRGERVGWVDGDDLYVLPEVAYKAAGTQHRDGLGVSETALRKRLRDAGLLVSTTEEHDGRLTVRAPRAVPHRPRVIHLRSSLAPGPPGPPGPEPCRLGSPGSNSLGSGNSAGPGLLIPTGTAPASPPGPAGRNGHSLAPGPGGPGPVSGSPHACGEGGPGCGVAGGPGPGAATGTASEPWVASATSSPNGQDEPATRGGPGGPGGPGDRPDSNPGALADPSDDADDEVLF